MPIIGMIAASFAPKHRNQIILWGVLGALIFRIIFASLHLIYLDLHMHKNFGRTSLIWIVNDLRRDLFNLKKN